MNKAFKYTEIAGVLFTVSLGSLWHFLYEWSGNNAVVGLFAPFNESTWEHLKLLFFPALIFLMGEAFFFYKKYESFFTAKLLGVTAGMVIIPLLFYGYTSVLGRHFLAADIGIFIISAVSAYLISYYFCICISVSKKYSLLSVCGLLLECTLFVASSVFFMI